ncbi:MAG: hypothetical protein AAF652_02670 [Cyanobacteria bacterium P01_C01_bin.72]
MNVDSTCPCCSRSMLLHISSRRSFWRCSHCRTEVPHTAPQKQLNKSTPIKLPATSLKATVAPLPVEHKVAAI